jgi:hypothetical protein
MPSVPATNSRNMIMAVQLVVDFWTAPVIASAARAAPGIERAAAARPEAAANAAVARFIISFPR